MDRGKLVIVMVIGEKEGWGDAPIWDWISCLDYYSDLEQNRIEPNGKKPQKY